MNKVIGIICILIIWSVSAKIINSPVILPTPIEVGKEFVNLLRDEVFYRNLLSTINKSVFASLLILILGIPIGMIIGFSKTIYYIFRPFITILQSVPVISWLAFAIFMWGIGWKGPIFISTMSLLPIVIINTASGMSNIDRELIEVAKIYNVSKKKTIIYIYLGSIVPFIIASMEVVFGNIWKTILVTEYLCGNSGIGVMIAWARSYIDTPQIFALTLVAVLLAISMEYLSKLIIKRLAKRWKLY